MVEAVNQRGYYLVLVIEDDRLIRLQLRGMLESLGYVVAEAATGTQGLEQYLRLRPDLVLLDAILPEVDGFTCCQQMRQQAGPDLLPILMITCLDDDASVDRAFEVGATDYVPKPIHWAVLRQRVQRLLQASQAMQTLQKQAESERRMRERERLLHLVAQRMRTSLQLHEILDTTVTEIRAFLDADRVCVVQFQADWSGRVIVESSAPGWPAGLGLETAADSHFGAHCAPRFCRGEISAIADVFSLELASHHLEVLAQLQVRAALVVPILQGQALWGLLLVQQCAAPRLWHDWEADWLRQLATQVSIALQQATLFEQVQQLNLELERQVWERTAQLQRALEFEATLKRITDKVRDRLDEETILQTAVRELALVLKVIHCKALLSRPDSNRPGTCYEYSGVMTVAEAIWAEQHPDEPAVYFQLLQGQWTQFCYCPTTVHPTSLLARSAILSCPISDDQGVLGSLWLLHPPEASFDGQSIRLVQQVANQCAIAVRQAWLYRAAQAQVAKLETLNSLKDGFLSTVSHELRAPMTNIKMTIHLLRLNLNRIQAHSSRTPGLQTELSKASDYIQVCHRECDRELGFIDDILDLQRLETSTHRLLPTTIHLQAWLPSVVEQFEWRRQLQRPPIRLLIPADLPPLVSDLGSLERILRELLNYTCKQRPAGDSIAIAAQAADDVIQLSILSTAAAIDGSGLPPVGNLSSLSGEGTWDYAEMGLGLTLVQKLVIQLGGTIWAENQPGQAHFLLELPVNLHHVRRG